MTEASQVSIKHHIDTDANWTMVNVTGCGKAFSIDFDEVFVRAEVMYQTMHRACVILVSRFAHDEHNIQ